MAVSTWGPDERVYRAQALTLQGHGCPRGFRLMAQRYLDERAWHYPSPLRWLWVLWCAVLARFGRRAPTLMSAALLPLAAAWAFQRWEAALLALTAPLVLTLGRRALQDLPVALLVVLALGLSLRGEVSLPFAAAVFALLAVKEAAVFYLPALAGVALVCGADPAQAALVTAGACGAWLAVTRLVVGPNTWAIMRSLRRAHASAYTLQYQCGAGHRLLVDLVLVSPLAVVLAMQNTVLLSLHVFVALALLAHALAPLRNVRNIVAVDLVLRAIVAANADWFGLAVLVMVDLLIAWSIRAVYDPTTHSLAQALGMLPKGRL